MVSPPPTQRGLVAILDALGAADFAERDIERFMKSRDLVLELLSEKAERVLGRIVKTQLATFTFNDTVVIVYRTDTPPTLGDVQAFFTLLRKFAVDSLANRILFRGAIAIGTFRMSEETNTILGE